MYETGMVWEHRPTKVIARRGARYLHIRTSANRELITVIAAGNAAGNGKTQLGLNVDPGVTVMSVSDASWMKEELAALWFTDVFLLWNVFLALKCTETVD